MRPRVVFLNRFYWPEEPATAQLLTDLAEALADRGFDVSVIASAPAAPGRPRREEHRGVVIHRVRGFRASRRGLLARAAEFVSFYPGALWRLLRLARRGDFIVAMTDPPLLGLLAWPVARLRGGRLVHWVQDIYPEIAQLLTGHRWLAVFRPLRNFAWRHATACLVPGVDMAATLRAAGVAPENLIVFPNWAPAGVAPPSSATVTALRQQWGIEGRFAVVYSGNLGRVHDLAPVLDLAAALQSEPEFVFLLIGAGAQRAELESAVQSRALANVRFLPAQPRAALAAALGAADVHLITLRPGAERSVFPSKLYGIARVGRPVLFIGAPESELARTIVTAGFGEAFARAETDRMAASLRRWRDEPAEREQLGRAALTWATPGLADAATVCARMFSAGLRGPAARSSDSTTP